MSDLVEVQHLNGLIEARRMVRDAIGYHFGGMVIPFAPQFKELALKALDRVISETPSRDACDECKGAGNVSTDSATCISCDGSGKVGVPNHR